MSTPRTADDSNPAVAILTALAEIVQPNTRVPTASIFVNDDTPLLQQTATFPAVVLEEGEQTVARIAYRLWQTKFTAILTYYDSWNKNPATIANVWANIDADMRRMLSNVQDNPRLVTPINGQGAFIIGQSQVRSNAFLRFIGTPHALATVMIKISDYKAILTPPDKPIPVPTVMRQMALQLNVPPYTSAA